MIRSYSVEQVRAAEAYYLARTSDGALMRRAAWAVAAAVLAKMPAPTPARSAALLVGAGNNGGDALLAGVVLRRHGMAVTALLAHPERAHAAGLAAFRRAGGRVLAAYDAGRAPDTVSDAGRAPETASTAGRAEGVADALRRVDVIVDGLVGLGARPPLRESAAALIEAANRADAWRIAIDLPSGIDPDTGLSVGPAFAADITVTLGGYKTGLFLSERAGEVRVANIGMDPADCDPPVPFDALAITAGDVPRLLPQPGPDDNKFSLGVTGIVAGSPRYPGAALLAVGGAVRTRPGLVRYAGPQAAAVLQRWPEVVAVDEIADAGRVQAWVVGPGMGTDGAAAARLQEVLDADAPVLVDADGLTILASRPWLLAGRAARGAVTVLTPHQGEFARLFPDLDPAGPAGRLAAVRAAAARSGAIVLLKGHRTVIAEPGRQAMVNMSGSAYLATAGSGDVLAGIAGALLSTGSEPLTAVALAAFVHGVAGELAAGPRCSGASALIDMVGPSLAALLPVPPPAAAPSVGALSVGASPPPWLSRNKPRHSIR